MDEMSTLESSVDASVADRLGQDRTAIEAYVAVWSRLLDRIRRHEAGAYAGRDPEELHDFRVAVRRTRSLLAAAKLVLPDAPRRSLRAEFKWVGDVTTPARDLDVLTHRLRDEMSALPTPVARDLDAVVAGVRSDRRAAHRWLRAGLRSDRFTRLREGWASTLADPPRDRTARDAEQPIDRVAAARIWDAYHRVVETGRQVSPVTPDDTLHAIRKDAKRLRYLLEAFGEVFDPEESRAAVQELKRLQDTLGALQDDVVLGGELRGLASRMARQGAPADTLLALGALIEQVRSRQPVTRAEFTARFATFDGDGNRRRFRDLFDRT